MKRRLRLLVLFGFGLLILWLGLSATSRIGEAYEAACSAHPRCPSIETRIFLLDLFVIACAVSLPWLANSLLASMDRDD
jgi:hypothetical protein